MKQIGRFVVTAVALLPSFAFAGDASSVAAVFGPVGAVGAAGASAAAVPTLSGGLLVALGVLVAVVALRFLKNSTALQRAVSAIFLGGGLILGGASIESTQATGTSIDVSNSVCTGGTQAIANDRPEDSNNPVTNGCTSASVQLLEWQSSCVGGPLIVPEGSEVGAILAPGESLDMAYCPGPG